MALTAKKTEFELEKVLQEYCLQAMGITTWQRRSLKSQYLPKDYLLLIMKEKEPLSAEKNELLMKMLQALHWEVDQSQIELIDKPVLQMVDLQRWNVRYKPKKILLMGIGFDAAREDMKIPFACVPSLSQLLIDKQLKKQAWQAMQPLITG